MRVIVMVVIMIIVMMVMRTCHASALSWLLPLSHINQAQKARRLPVSLGRHAAAPCQPAITPANAISRRDQPSPKFAQLGSLA
jgi:hypothetical protein